MNNAPGAIAPLDPELIQIRDACGFNYYAKGLSWDAARSSSISTA